MVNYILDYLNIKIFEMQTIFGHSGLYNLHVILFKYKKLMEEIKNV
jgi:hypothetical protein